MCTKYWLNACSDKRKYLHNVLVNCLLKLAQEKVWLFELRWASLHDDLISKEVQQSVYSNYSRIHSIYISSLYCSHCDKTLLLKVIRP